MEGGFTSSETAPPLSTALRCFPGGLYVQSLTLAHGIPLEHGLEVGTCWANDHSFQPLAAYNKSRKAVFLEYH